MMNGRAWMILHEDAKTFYLGGLHDAMVAEAIVYFSSSDEVKKRWASGFTVGDYLKELDDLYKDRENLLLPVPAAMRYCTDKLKGERTKVDLEQELIALRKLYR
jgi:hypothetical protein